jgi:hypothetical protein
MRKHQINGRTGAGNGAVDTFAGQQKGALYALLGTQFGERRLQRLMALEAGEMIKCGDDHGLVRGGCSDRCLHGSGNSAFAHFRQSVCGARLRPQRRQSLDERLFGALLLMTRKDKRHG